MRKAIELERDQAREVYEGGDAGEGDGGDGEGRGGEHEDEGYSSEEGGSSDRDKDSSARPLPVAVPSHSSDDDVEEFRLSP